MKESEPYFVIPTHRLRDVGSTVHDYDEHFRRSGHSVQMIVFDDSTQANVEKYLPQFERTKTRSDLYYVGPREKEQFILIARKTPSLKSGMQRAASEAHLNSASAAAR